MCEYERWVEDILLSIQDYSKLEKNVNDIKNNILSIIDFKFKYPELLRNFLDVQAPKIIINILKTKPCCDEHAIMLNSIIECFLRILPNVLYMNIRNFNISVLKIIKMNDYKFYTLTKPKFEFYKSNLNLFVNSDTLKNIICHMNENDEMFFDSLYTELTTFFDFNNYWTNDQYLRFMSSFENLFSKAIDSLDYYKLRNLNEHVIVNIFKLFFSKIGENNDFYNLMMNLELELYLKMLKSNLMSKQFTALQMLKSKSNLDDSYLQKLKDEDILDLLMNNLHYDLMKNFTWLLSIMLNKSYATIQQLSKFWKITTTEFCSSFEVWLDLFKNLSQYLKSQCLLIIQNTNIFPYQIFSFLKKISLYINDNQKVQMFNCLFILIFNQSNSYEYNDILTQTIPFFLPKNVEQTKIIKLKCLELFKEKNHEKFALSIMKKISIYFESNEAKEIYQELIKYQPNLLENADDYLDFFVNILRNFNRVLTQEESNNFQKMIIPLIQTNPNSLENFFIKILKTQKYIFPDQFYSSFFLKVCSCESVNESLCSLVLYLFMHINKNVIDQTSQQIYLKSFNNLMYIDNIWSLLAKYTSKKISNFLIHIYFYSNDNNFAQIFVNKCLEQPISYGKLFALSLAIDSIELILPKSENINKWEYENSYIKIKTIGLYSGYFVLPSQIFEQKLKKEISNFLSIKTDFLSIKIDDKLVENKLVNLEETSIIKTDSYIHNIRIPLIPTNYLNEDHKIILLSLMKSEDDRIAKIAFEIANLIPTSESEKQLFISGNIDWCSYLNTSHIYLLFYRLNIIGNFIHTKYIDQFLDNGITLYVNKLIYKRKLYQIDHIVLKIIVSIISDEKIDKLLWKFDEDSLTLLIHFFLGELERDDSITNDLLGIIVNIFKKIPKYQNVLKGKELIIKLMFNSKVNFRKAISSLFLFRNDIKELLNDMLYFSNTEHCKEFFEVLLQTVNGNDKYSKISSFFFLQFDNIKRELEFQYPYDEFVNGMISILLKINLDDIDNSKLVKILLNYVLFNPLKYYSLNQNFYKLLNKLLKIENNYQIVLNILSKFHKSYTIDSCNEIPLSTKKFKGLKNLGATCYANSVLQQLFYIKEFRNLILSKHAEQGSWIFELQLLFSRMLFSPFEYIDTSNFFKLWRGWDGEIVHTFEQQDSVEFLQLIIDRTAELFPEATEIFKGSILHKIVGTEVSYENKNEEQFTTISIDVINQKNIYDSFEHFLIPDFHTNYEAGDLGKIDVKRYHQISKFPEVFIIQLKRFSYDIQNGIRHKIESEFAFPIELDVSKITRDDKKIYYE